jgi:hypothetical protein
VQDRIRSLRAFRNNITNARGLNPKRIEGLFLFGAHVYRRQHESKCQSSGADVRLQQNADERTKWAVLDFNPVAGKYECAFDTLLSELRASLWFALKDRTRSVGIGDDQRGTLIMGGYIHLQSLTSLLVVYSFIDFLGVAACSG